MKTVRAIQDKIIGGKFYNRGHVYSVEDGLASYRSDVFVTLDDVTPIIEEKKPVQSNYDDLTKKELSKLLDERGIEHDVKVKKSDLIQLLEEPKRISPDTI